MTMNSGLTSATLPNARIGVAFAAGHGWSGVFFSCLFAALILVGPWELIRGGEFADLVNYRTRIYELHDYGMRYFVWEDSLLGWLRYEFLWFWMLAFVADNNIHPNVFIAAVTGISAFLTHSFLRRHLGVLLATLVLLNPITIDLLSSQIRSALAFSLFLAIVAWQPPVRIAWLKPALFIPLPFIHTGLLLIIGLYAGCVVLARLRAVAPQLKVVAIVAAAVALAVSIVVLLPSIVEATEDRRNLSQYGLKSPAYLSYWVVCAGALIVSVNRELAARWEYFFTVIVCLTAPLLELTGLPGFRFIALAIPVFFVALSRLQGGVLHGFLFATVLYQFLLILYWVQ